MLKIVPSNQFRKDLKLSRRRGYDLSLLNDVVAKLARREPLPVKNKDHGLSGAFHGFRECHIQPDWLLIYRIDEDDLLLFLTRTGTHADLFD